MASTTIVKTRQASDKYAMAEYQLLDDIINDKLGRKLMLSNKLENE